MSCRAASLTDAQITAGNGVCGECGLVAEERRGGAGLGQHVPGGRVQFGQPDPGRGLVADGGQDAGDDLAGGVHGVDLAWRLVLDHRTPPELPV